MAIIPIRSREELIAFGARIATAIRAIHDEPPIVISANGDNQSGKSLVALAIDRSLYPERYPKGLTEYISADLFLNWRNHKDAKTIFENFSTRYDHVDYSVLQIALTNFMSDNKGMRVYFASNLEMAIGQDVDRYKYLDSKQFDLSFHVKVLPGDFARQITIGYVSQRLQCAWDKHTQS